MLTGWTRRILSSDFKIPNGLAITKFHVFTFHKDSLGCVSFRRLSTDETSKSFALTDKQIPESFFREWASRMTQEEFKSFIVPLEDVSSAHHTTRKNYLKLNVLDRYYANDALVRQNVLETAQTMSINKWDVGAFKPPWFRAFIRSITVF